MAAACTAHCQPDDCDFMCVAAHYDRYKHFSDFMAVVVTVAVTLLVLLGDEYVMNVCDDCKS